MTGKSLAGDIMRVEQPELYADLARLPELLIALHRVYSREWSVESDSDFVADFKDKARSARERCAAWYKPSGLLAALFRVDYADAKDRLGQYVSVCRRALMDYKRVRSERKEVASRNRVGLNGIFEDLTEFSVAQLLQRSVQRTKCSAANLSPRASIEPVF